MIHFIIGGLYQGQEEYLQEHYQELLEQDRVYFPAEDIFSSWTLEEVKALLEKDQELVIAGRDIGQGLVPLEAALREKRDHIGRVYQTIAKKASRITFCVAGLYQELK